MNEVWVIEREACDRFSDTEKTMRNPRSCDFPPRKTVFSKREDAEDYVRPIVKKAFDMLISDMTDNVENPEHDELGQLEEIEEYKKRGWQEIRCEKLTKESPFYKFYGQETPTTVYVCPIQDEYDNIGHFFVSIRLFKIY